jgi:ketosteroid isomerase-like protein
MMGMNTMGAKVLLPVCALVIAGCATTSQGPAAATPPSGAVADAIRTECAFAKTMADRDFEGFAAFLDEQAVFFNKDGALFGKDAVLKEWKPYFDGPQAPFSWVPAKATWNKQNLAYTTGPVFDANGKCVARFNSIWRRHDDGHWYIVFDKGDRQCDPAVFHGGEATGASALDAAQALFRDSCQR